MYKESLIIKEKTKKVSAKVFNKLKRFGNINELVLYID